MDRSLLHTSFAKVKNNSKGIAYKGRKDPGKDATLERFPSCMSGGLHVFSVFLLFFLLLSLSSSSSASILFIEMRAEQMSVGEWRISL